MAKRDRDAVTQGLKDIFSPPTEDLLGSVIRRDRQRAGRSQAGSAEEVGPALSEPNEAPDGVMTGHNVSLSYASMTSSEAASLTTKEAFTETDMQAGSDESFPARNEGSGQRDTEESYEAGSVVSKRTSRSESGVADRLTRKSVIPRADAGDGEGRSRVREAKSTRRTDDLLDSRVAEAKRMAESSSTTVTLRIPRELNDWLDEYVHRAWPERVRKQELVTEGLRLLFARRGRAGEPIVGTSLLPE